MFRSSHLITGTGFCSICLTVNGNVPLARRPWDGRFDHLYCYILRGQSHGRVVGRKNEDGKYVKGMGWVSATAIVPIPGDMVITCRSSLRGINTGVTLAPKKLSTSSLHVVLGVIVTRLKAFYLI